MAPREGEIAPGFETLLCDGETFRAASFEDVLTDSGGVLVFSAFAFSAIAENWWGRYERSGWHEFDVPVLGVFPDGPYSVNTFIRDIDSPFPFASDVNDRAGAAYGLLTPRDGMGPVETVRRAVFVVDGARTVVHAWIAEDWTTPTPTADVERAVSSL